MDISQCSSSTTWPETAQQMPRLIPRPSSMDNINCTGSEGTVESGAQPFKCCVCEEPFFDVELLKIHEETHIPEAPFGCRFCGSLFAVLDELRSHTCSFHYQFGFGPPGNYNSHILHHVGPPMGQHQTPPPMFTAQPPALHEVLNTNQPFVTSNEPEFPYQCVECKGNFQKHELYPHMRAHLKQKNIFSDKSFKCEQCGKVFEKELTLQKHVDSAHPPEVVSSVGEGGGGSKLLLEALRSDARCLSPSVTKSGGKLQPLSEATASSSGTANVSVKHEPDASLGEEKVNSTVCENPILTQLLSTASKGPPETTTTPTLDIKKEIKTESPSPATPPPPPPAAAPSSASTEPSLEGGFIISSVATVDPSFLKQLDELENRKQNSANNENEKKQVEEDFGEFEDDGEDNTDGAQLLEPLETQPTDSVSLNQERSTTTDTTLGPYTCSACGKGFKEHFGLRQHLRVVHYAAKPHRCRECGKKFSKGISMYVHMRIHTAMQPFTCIVCFKTFVRSASLNGHLSSHTGTRLRCLACGKVEKSLYFYMHHVEKTHPDFMAKYGSRQAGADKFHERRRKLVQEITEGIQKYRSEIPDVLETRSRGEAMRLQKLPEEVSSSSARNEDSTATAAADSAGDQQQSEEVSSASDYEQLPALRAELRKRPVMRSPDLLTELESRARKSARTGEADPIITKAPNLKRLLEQDSSSHSINTPSQGILTPGSVKSEQSG